MYVLAMPLAFLSFALPIFGQTIGASATEIGALYTAFTITALLARLAVGLTLDRYGYKWFFVGALVVYAASMVAYGIANSVADLSALEELLFLGTLNLSGNSTLSDLSPSRAAAG